MDQGVIYLARLLISRTDRHSRRRPFTNWMKRLANLKSSSSDSASNGAMKHSLVPMTSRSKAKKAVTLKNNPYPASGKPDVHSSNPNSANGHLSFYTPPSGRSLNYVLPSQSQQSLGGSSEGQPPPTTSGNSAAPTLGTNRDTVHSETAQSKAETSGTVGGGLSSSGIGGGEGSTFSSPAPSVRSLSTTLTTMQSAAPSALMHGNNPNNHHGAPSIPTSHNHATQFSHQFPTSPLPSAIPSHLTSHQSGGHPATYDTVTANNLLTDNASILTLASSSKRRRRNSLDTNASVRALAPSSVFGGSRESLPLSVLSSTVGDQTSNITAHHGRPAVAGLASAERASVYSSSGIAPALSSERNSYYAAKQINAGDAASVRSGLVNHGRNDSITGSIGGIASTGSPLASPKEHHLQGRISRRNSGRGDVGEDEK